MTASSSSTSRTSPRPPRPKRRSRWPFVVFTVVVIAMSVWWAKSAIIRAVALPVASRVTGCNVRCASATISAGGEIVLRDVEVRAPGVRGPAAEVLAAHEVRIAIDWSTFPPTLPRAIEVRRANIRLSQAEDLSLNIAPVLRSSAGSTTPPPDVRLIDATIELGEHRGNQFAPMAHLSVSGSLTASDASRSVFSLVLSQARAATSSTDRDRTTILGTINRATGSLHIDAVGLDLSDLNPAPGASSFRGYWEQLGINGRIPDASVDYAPDTGLAATFSLDNVAMSIPVPATPDPAYADPDAVADQIEPLAMSAVTGSVRFDASGLHADLEGSIEDLRCAVMLVTDGLSLDAPLTCTLQIPEFILTDEPRLRPFAPQVARTIFHRFSGPTAALSGRVDIRRGHDRTRPDRWSYRGAFKLRNGTARYEGFPYPVSEIDATFRFDDTEFRVVGLSGVGPTGAKVLASGRIWPPNALAAMDLDITAVDLPMDEAFRDSMPETYREVFDLMFDREAHAELVRKGLVAETAAQKAPEFRLGGLGALDLKVKRERGMHTEYTADITLRMPRASFLPREFQYPVIATDAVFHITRGLVTIPPTALSGLTGATGTMSGEVVYPVIEGEEYEPDLRLAVADVPVDPLLMHAIDQRVRTAEGAAPIGHDPGAIVRGLNVQGRVRCEAHILTRDGATLGVDADVTLEDLSANPGPDLALTDLSGVIHVSESRVSSTAISARLEDSALTIALDAPLTPDTTDPTHLTVDAVGLDLSRPIEQAALSLLSPEQAAEVAALRSRYRPTGEVDVGLVVSAHPGAPWSWAVDMRRARDLGVSLDPGRLVLADVRGRVGIDPDAVRFEEFSSPASLDGESVGAVAVSGVLARTPTGPTDLRLGISEARFESAAVRRFVRDRSPEVARTLEEYSPSGAFSVNLVRTHHPPEPARTDWTLAIERLALVRDGTPIPIRAVSGPIAGTESAGHFGPIRAEGDGWMLSMDGTWDSAAGVALDANLGLTVSSITESFLAGLPRPIDAVLRGLEARSDGRLELREARLRIASSAAGREPSLDFSGILDLDRVGISAGVPIDDITGGATFAYHSTPGSDAEFRLDLDGATATVLGVSIADARADFAADPSSDAILLRSLDASVHGGRLLARGAFHPPGIISVGSMGFALDADLQSADFDAVLRDLQPDTADQALPPVDRGRLDASLSVSGGADGDDGALQGRLTARVEGGDVLNLPGVVPLLQVWNLQLPAGERVELAFADAFIDGMGLVFDELGLYSNSLRLTGTGSIRWSDESVDLRFESEGVNRIPVLSELFRGVQGEIATARVTGRLSDPKLEYESLSGAKRIFGAIFGDPDPEPGTR